MQVVKIFFLLFQNLLFKVPRSKGETKEKREEMKEREERKKETRKGEKQRYKEKGERKKKEKKKRKRDIDVVLATSYIKNNSSKDIF